MNLYASPLQGFTDFRFRNAFQKYFGGIDTFYSPYIKLNGKLEIKSSYQRDILPENNSTLTVIPQIITNDADEFLFVAKFVKQLGYNELNWNLGCPYPMVAKCGMGSGLISNTTQIAHILEKVHQESDIVVSLKMRMGYENASEILDVFPILDQYPIKNIAIHARIGKQLYKGGVDLDAFETCIKHTKHKIYYNGDITTVEKHKELQQRFPEINDWMIGRGVISNPFLPNQIKNNSSEFPENRLQIFQSFHDEIYQAYDAFLQGPTPIRMKMLGFWEYFSTLFPNPQKTLKKIKKSGSSKNYQIAVSEIFKDGF